MPTDSRAVLNWWAQPTLLEFAISEGTKAYEIELTADYNKPQAILWQVEALTA